MRLGRTFAALGALVASVLLATACAGGGGGAGGSTAAGSDLGLVAPGHLRVGIDTNSKPFSYAEGNNFTGFDVELLTYMAKKMDLTPEFVGMEFSSILPTVANGQIDTASSAISITDARKQTVDFSDGYFIGYLTMLTREGSGVTDSKDSVAGKKIGVITGSFQDAYATKNFTQSEIVRFSDHNSTFAALKNGTIDGQFFDLPIAKDYLNGNPGIGLKTVLNTPLTDAPSGFPVHKGNTALAQALNGALKQAIDDGTYKTLFDKYFQGQPLPDQFKPKA